MNWKLSPVFFFGFAAAASLVMIASATRSLVRHAEPDWNVVVVGAPAGNQITLRQNGTLGQCRKAARAFNLGRTSVGAPSLDYSCVRKCWVLDRFLSPSEATISDGDCLVVKNQRE